MLSDDYEYTKKAFEDANLPVQRFLPATIRKKRLDSYEKLVKDVSRKMLHAKQVFM